MKNLVRNLILEHTAFKNMEDYEKFLVAQSTTMYDSGSAEETTRKRTYFTYNGLLKVIFRSNSGTAYRFRKWASKVIYTAHLGTDEQRYEQALDMVGVNSSIVKEVFDTCVTKVPCVYLFYIGKVKNMVKDYPELKPFRSGMVFKYGKTISLHRRLIEHIDTYGSLKNSDLKLSQWSPINEKMITKAENSLSRFFKDKKIPFQGHSEIVVLSRTDLGEVKVKYLEVYNTFGIVTDLAAIMTTNKELVHTKKYQQLLLKMNA